VSQAVSRGRVADDWPNTTRALPWLLAGFAVMLYLVPFDAIDLPVALPVDAKLDRFVLAGIAAIWIGGVAVGATRGTQRRAGLIDVAVLGFVIVAVLSVALNLGTVANIDLTELGVKRLALLLAYVTFFYMVVTIMRPSEVNAFAALIVGLACVTAIGTIWEYRTDSNIFYTVAKMLPAVDVADPLSDPDFGRQNVIGPTGHGLALTTLLALALPFAVTGLWRAPDVWRKLLFGCAAAILIAGAFATLRKSSLVVPGVALLVLLAQYPRGILRLIPLALAVVTVSQVAAPGAIARTKAQFTGGFASANTTQGRTDDYTAIMPDVLSYPALGRGYGTYDPDSFRILDNDYLGLLVEVGVVGVLAYVAMWLIAAGVAYRASRHAPPELQPAALAVVAGCVAFGVSTALYDVLSYPHATYLFFLLAGMAAVLRSPAAVAAPAGRRRLPAGSRWHGIGRAGTASGIGS
jgi:hypothetical protein